MTQLEQHCALAVVLIGTYGSLMGVKHVAKRRSDSESSRVRHKNRTKPT